MIAWVASHPAEAWFVASACLNIALRLRTPEEWVTLGERYPFAALVIRQIRAWGMDPTAAIRAAQKYALARASRP